MTPKTAFFLGAVSAKLDFLREDLVNYCSDGQGMTPAAFYEIRDSVDKIRDMVEKIYAAENEEAQS